MFKKKEGMDKDIRALILVDNVLQKLAHHDRRRILKFLIEKYTVGVS